ncbi:hypothetical protein OBBRIDRAFT_823704 [Obba rivulosa]|uniref:Uncharacterized protein n=1 Tax=Obba rivulosa TaxID=1052685 RepID=A0A8E2DQS7_9APHY|nr:hypothetical protein OBBRIDRAFT_823704 [Obba rivulosa]
MSLGVPGRLVVRGTGNADTSAADFLVHPDFRVLSAFFLGWAFLLSGQYILTCSFLRNLAQWSYRSAFECKTSKHRAGDADLEASSREPSHRLHASRHEVDDAALLFVFNLCFASSALTQFGSLLEFSPGSANTICTFVVAWSGMSSQLARLIGLLLLNRKLHMLSGKLWEKYLVWAGMFISLALDFAFNATNTGVINEVSRMDIWLCDRQRYLPTALASLISSTIVEVYFVCRLTTLAIVSRGKDFGHRNMAYGSFAKAVSLVVLDALTTASRVARVSEVAEFIPFSIGAVLCLAAFNFPQELFSDVAGSSAHTHEPPIVVDFERSSSATDKAIISVRPPSPMRTCLVDHETVASEWRLNIEPYGPLSSDVLVINPLNDGEHTSSEDSDPMKSAPALSGHPHPTLHSPGLHILPNQTEVAELLERKFSPSGPVVRQPRTRPQVFVVTEDYDDQEPQKSPISVILGSDIIRPTPMNRRSREPWSPGSSVERSYFSPASADSHASWRSGQQISTMSSGERDMSRESFIDSYVRTSERGSQATSTVFYRSSSSKSPRTSFRHSFLSTLAQTQRELAVILERPPDHNRGTIQSMKSRKSKRSTFGRQIPRGARQDSMPVTPATENIRSFIPDLSTPRSLPPYPSLPPLELSMPGVAPRNEVIRDASSSDGSIRTGHGRGMKGPRPLPIPSSPAPSSVRQFGSISDNGMGASTAALSRVRGTL